MKALEEYRKGSITLSGAASMAASTIWEIMQYFKEQGYVSDYSLADLEKELRILKSFNS